MVCPLLFANPQRIASSDTFKAQSDALTNAMSKAKTVIGDSNLPESIKQQAVQNLTAGNFKVNTVGSGAAKNLTTVRFCFGNLC